VTARLLNDSGARFVSPLAFGDNVKGAAVVGVTGALVQHLSDGLAEGRAFASRSEAVVGAASPLRVGDTFRPSHGAHGAGRHAGGDAADGDEHAPGHDVVLTVVGRMKPTGSPWDRAIALPVERVWEMHGLPTGHPPGSDRIGPPFDPASTPGVPAAVVHPDKVATAYRLRQAYTTNESMAFFPAEALVQLYSVVGDVRQLMSVLAVVTQALVLLAIVAAVFILVRLLMPQYVTLRAMGAPRRYVFAAAWGFTAILVTAGIAAGLAGGYALSFGIGVWMSERTGIALSPSLGAAEALVGLAVLATGLVLALLPAAGLYRRPLAEAISRY
jgi:putative ABC transport system permease protein